MQLLFQAVYNLKRRRLGVNQAQLQVLLPLIRQRKQATFYNMDLNSFQMTVEKPIPKYFIQAITDGADRVMNQSESPAITRNLLKARENQAFNAIGCGFVLLVS